MVEVGRESAAITVSRYVDSVEYVSSQVAKSRLSSNGTSSPHAHRHRLSCIIIYIATTLPSSTIRISVFPCLQSIRVSLVLLFHLLPANLQRLPCSVLLHLYLFRKVLSPVFSSTLKAMVHRVSISLKQVHPKTQVNVVNANTCVATMRS